MKKIILLLSLALLLVNCKTDNSSSFDKNCKECKTIKYISSQRVPLRCYEGSHWEKISVIRKFEYEGHVYIQFIVANDHIGQGIVHDPNCPCRNN